MSGRSSRRKATTAPDRHVTSVALPPPRRHAEVAELKRKLKDAIGWVESAPVLTRGQFTSRVSRHPNIVGIGYGVKMRGGKVTHHACLRVYVTEKPRGKGRAIGPKVPGEIDGVPTDVIAVPGPRHCAAKCGSSVGLYGGPTGTIACVVQDSAGAQYILSNNHVLANLNTAPLGSPIIQPGAQDGGGLPAIATLYDYQPLNFSGGINLFDAAIAKLTFQGTINPALNGIGPIAPPVVVASAMLPVSHSRHADSPGDVVGGLMHGLSEDFSFPYAPGMTALFHNLLSIVGTGGEFAQPGDSGALVVTQGGTNPVGLLFGSDPTSGLGFASPIGNVLAHFNVSIVLS